jgi:hypothetical protein
MDPVSATPGSQDDPLTHELRKQPTMNSRTVVEILGNCFAVLCETDYNHDERPIDWQCDELIVERARTSVRNGSHRCCPC